LGARLPTLTRGLRLRAVYWLTYVAYRDHEDLMAPAKPAIRGRLMAKLRTTVGKRFTRFIRVAIVSLATSEATLAACDGVFHLTAIPAAVSSWFTGAVVSYLLSRWAWERKGRPDLLRETVPFWVISALVVVILSGATKLGYWAATRMHLHGAGHVAFVGLVYLIANFITFLLRFVIFHYVLFADPKPASQDAETPSTAPGAMVEEERAGRSS
jgi:putative flippase GtrA